MNIFYAPPSQIDDELIELKNQEAAHASKALRYKQGDNITVVDGKGGWYEGRVQLIADDSVRIVRDKSTKPKKPQPAVVLGLGIIKKRDRLEFAVEKAVELGVKEIALFQSQHTVKKNVRLDRLQSIVVSAMKQSLRCWLPKLRVFKNVQQVVEAYDGMDIIVAHESEQQLMDLSPSGSSEQRLLLIGPEGGFSEQEITSFRDAGGDIVSLGDSRLRSETAAITLLNQFNYAHHQSDSQS